MIESTKRTLGSDQIRSDRIVREQQQHPEEQRDKKMARHPHSDRTLGTPLIIIGHVGTSRRGSNRRRRPCGFGANTTVMVAYYSSSSSSSSSIAVRRWCGVEYSSIRADDDSPCSCFSNDIRRVKDGKRTTYRRRTRTVPSVRWGGDRKVAQTRRIIMVSHVPFHDFLVNSGSRINRSIET